MGENLTTWDEFREMLASAYGLAVSEYDAVADNLMCGGERRQALYDLSAAMREARDNLKRLTELAFTFEPPTQPARPLEAVLADIEAEGHTNLTLSRHGGSWWLNTNNETAPYPSEGSNVEWMQVVESSLIWDDEDPVRMAEKRLADIRKLHAEKADHHVLAGVGMVHIESDQDGRYAVGELAREGDQQPWKVVDRAPMATPVVVFEFMHREEAESCRDALNTGAFAPLMCPDPEHEDRMRQDRDAAAEDIRREALASEEAF